jgi:hypothetical protein
MEAIADKEEIEVADADVQIRIDETLEEQSDPRTREAYRRHYSRQDNRDNLKFSMRLERLTDMLLDKAEITEVDQLPEHDNENSTADDASAETDTSAETDASVETDANAETDAGTETDASTADEVSAE